MANRVFSGSAIRVSGLDTSCFNEEGTVINDVEKVLRQAGFAVELADLKQDFLQIIPQGVQTAGSGVIQDPAGSAIGDPGKPVNTGAGGGSRAIYKAFPDLEPIPKMNMGDSVFNTSTGPGKRVLHTYSPDLALGGTSPANHKDREKAISVLANAYFNAYQACNAARYTKGGPLEGIHEVGLVPLSGKIYAGGFIDTTLNHLHPSYTICAIMIAQGILLQQQQPVMASFLYYYTGDSDAPYNAAVAIIKGMIGGL